MKDTEKAPDLSRLYRGIRRDAQKQLTDHFDRLVADRRAARSDLYGAEEAAVAAVGRLLNNDEEYAAAVRPHVAGSADSFVDLDEDVHPLRGLSRESMLRLTSGCAVEDAHIRSGNIVAFIVGKDTRMDVFTRPYADSWTHVEGRHRQLSATADKSTGFLRVVYTINKEGGSAYLGAGVAVLFMRNAPGHPPGQGPAGAAQIRTNTPYNYRWRDVSYLGPAHQHAGFGVLVGSWDIKGGPGRVEQDHQYWRWHDGTDWYKEHSNPSWSGFDNDTALNYADEAPYFQILPGRMYIGWVWCFAEGDAHGADLTSAGFAQAQIDATVNMIVVGQQ